MKLRKDNGKVPKGKNGQAIAPFIATSCHWIIAEFFPN